jgi:TPR repeat protein
MTGAARLAFHAALCFASAAAMAQAPPPAPAAISAPQELIEVAKHLPRPPGYEDSAKTTRGGLPLLFQVGADQLLAQEALRPKLDALVQAYRREAEAGDAIAQSSFARICYVGAGVPRDEKEAYKWARRAAENGEPTAQSSLGYLLASGKGVEKDVREAEQWYRKAAEQGDVYAWTNLSYLTKDREEQRQWLKKAVDRGEPYAMLRLGDFNLLGTGIPANPDQAEQLYRRAGALWRQSAADQKLEVSERARRLFVQARAAVRDKDFSEATQLLTQAKTMAPWAPMLWYNEALVAGETGLFASAVAHMQVFLGMAPDAPQARGAQDLIYEWERKVKK